LRVVKRTPQMTGRPPNLVATVPAQKSEAHPFWTGPPKRDHTVRRSRPSEGWCLLTKAELSAPRIRRFRASPNPSVRPRESSPDRAGRMEPAENFL
jgi:hypothetical protein